MEFENSISNKKNHLFDLLNSIEYNETTVINIKNIILSIQNDHKNNILNNLEFIEKKNFIIIKTQDISENLRHANNILDIVLHQTKICVIDKTNYKPLIYTDKPIRHINSDYINNKNSYLKNHIYDEIKNFATKEFDRNIISIYNNYIGSYIVLFNHDNIWKFLFLNNIYVFNIKNHYILYNHLYEHITKLDKKLCYHLLLVDKRIRNLISYPFDNNYVVLIKTTEKYTLNENFNNPYDFFTTNKKIYISCMDELNLYIETLDTNNTNMKKIAYKGLIMKVDINMNDSIYIRFDTETYKNLLHIIPKGLSLHEIYLHLYQNDKLSDILRYINDTSSDIIKRINVSIGTLSREILDIYHMTRNQNNGILYNLLPYSYRQILYYLHSDYIEQKNNTNPDNIKISIAIEHVYNKLKEIDTKLLVNLYKDRNNLDMCMLNSGYNIKKILKICIYTQIQSKLLSL